MRTCTFIDSDKPNGECGEPAAKMITYLPKKVGDFRGGTMWVCVDHYNNFVKYADWTEAAYEVAF